MRKNDLISIKQSSPLLLRYIISSWKFWWLLVGYDMELLGQQKRKFPKVWFKDTYRAPADVELNFTAFPNCPIFPLNNDIELRMGEEWLWHDKVGIVPFFAQPKALDPVCMIVTNYLIRLLNCWYSWVGNEGCTPDIFHSHHNCLLCKNFGQV